VSDLSDSVFIGFLFGYDSGIISSTIVQPYFEAYMGTPTSSQTGGIVSSFTGGAILGALSIAWLPDILGRKMTVFIGACISVLGCALQAGAVNIGMMIVGRAIAGIAVGLLSAVVPMYCVSLNSYPTVFVHTIFSSVNVMSLVRDSYIGRSRQTQWSSAVHVVLGILHRTMARIWLFPGQQ
jgi:MFS family permease